jgi:hypothetical protein
VGNDLACSRMFCDSASDRRLPGFCKMLSIYYFFSVSLLLQGHIECLSSLGLGE